MADIDEIRYVQDINIEANLTEQMSELESEVSFSLDNQEMLGYQIV